MNLQNLIWIEEAAKQYKRSRAWFDEQVKAGKLSVATMPGDRKVYLLKSELEKFMSPNIMRADDTDTQVG